MLSTLAIGTHLQPTQSTPYLKLLHSPPNRTPTPATNRSLITSSNKPPPPLVKMCGITSARDASLAASSGADLVGMILSPNFKRSVSPSTALSISRAARSHNSHPVAVFVNEGPDTILKLSESADIDLVQLHGPASRAALRSLLPHRRVIYVLHANENGHLSNDVAEIAECGDDVEWVLVDSAKGGSGEGFDWGKFRLPEIRSKRGWLLAGGINAANVAEAIKLLGPDGVDVSSGICGPDGVTKDEGRIRDFMNAVKSVDKVIS